LTTTNTPTPTVLVVDDDPAVGKVLGALLRQDGITAQVASSGAEALQALEDQPFEVVVTDVRMPGMDGMELLAEIKRRWPELPVVMLTAFGTVQLAVEAMKAGAAEFVLKPFDRQEILFVIRKALSSYDRAAEGAPHTPLQEAGIIGESLAMQEVARMIDRAASSDATVLIRGESGTGKELVVEAVHRRSSRRDKPLVKVHFAAVPETLLEAELFGYEKGAFTGAVTRKPGRAELADGGTLFLDEVGDIPPTVQVKLLRLLQGREFERVGGTQTLSVDTRFVAATHRDLEEMLEHGDFREDLFYRLNVIPIYLPPLRERDDDVDALARHFCKTFGQANGKPEITIEQEGIALLRTQAWPGNVRQLQNLIERLVVLADQPLVTAQDVERELAPPSSKLAGHEESVQRAVTLESLVNETVRQALVRTLKSCGNNRSQAARILGISRRTLYNKLKEHGLC
jgi:two-component system response regulator AtoC